MRVLLDECVPRKLKLDLIGHDVQAVVDIGWSSKRNGELLQLMLAQKFEVLLTDDQNLELQQNVRTAGLGVVVGTVRRNREEGTPASRSGDARRYRPSPTGRTHPRRRRIGCGS